jgi:hypothetical protein
MAKDDQAELAKLAREAAKSDDGAEQKEPKPVPSNGLDAIRHPPFIVS